MHVINLDHSKEWKISVDLNKRKRSESQNAYLWGVCYPTILKAGGETLRGWTADDLHDYFLIEHFGHEVIEGFGRKRLKPLKRSSKLTTLEFTEFVEFIQQKAAEMGIVIPDPEPHHEPT